MLLSSVLQKVCRGILERSLNKHRLFDREKRRKKPIQKTAADVDKILKMAEKLSKDYEPFPFSHENGYGYVCDLNINSQDSLVAATNRGFLLRKQDSQKVLIYDGTHRLTAYAVGKLMKMKGLPDSLNGFSWEEIA